VVTTTVCSVGDLVVDIVVHLDRDPQRGTDTPAAIVHRRGGSAANVAVGVAAAGATGRFVGQVGDDEIGSMLITSLTESGVDSRVVQRGTSGAIVVLVDPTGERSFLTDRGAAIHLSGISNDVLDEVDLLHVPAYSLTAGALAETTQQLIGDAVDRDIPVSLSTSSVSVLAEYGRERFLDLVRIIKPRFIFANHEEASFMLQGHPWFRHADATVVTAAGGEARFVQPDGFDARARPESVEVLDTTGAGDAFTAGFLVAHLDGKTPEDSLIAGHSLARRTLESAGAALGGPDPEDATP